MIFILPIMLILIMTIVAVFAGFTLYAIYSNAPYVPTHNHLVEKMLDMAEVSRQDLVIDLGAGDGRIVMAAAKRGAIAIGYEINPVLVFVGNLRIWPLKPKFQNLNFKLNSKSKIQNILSFGFWILFDICHSGFGFLTRSKPDYPKIYLNNFWSQNLSSATVITIFGFPNMMGRLEKKLKKELKPGSRVVSHAFRFPNWQPAKREDGLLLYEVS